jgi:uncharacterized protein (DUF2267 family)
MKQVPDKLKKMLENIQIKALLNRESEIDYYKLIKGITPDPFTRNPTVVCDENGDYVGTTLDLQSAIYVLLREGANINVPYYEAMRGTVLKEGESVVSKDNRHGKVVGLSCSKDLWSFGLRIIDYNVMKATTSGEPRVFNVMNIEGEWHDGWRKIEFIPTEKADDFFMKLASDNKITFNKFVNEQRRFNIYSFNYFMIKIAIARLNDEATYLSGLIKLMNDEGIVLPPKDQKEWPQQTKLGNEKSITVQSVTYEVDVPPITSNYPMVEFNLDNLKWAIKRRKELIYKIKPQLQFYIRGEEFANFKNTNPDKPFPHWMKGVTWNDYKSPKKFTVNPNFIKKFSGDTRSILALMRDRVYKENEKNQFFAEFETLNKLFFDTSEIPEEVRKKAKFTKGRVALKRLVIFQPGLGEYSVSLLKKEFEKTEMVNENYNQ